MDDEEIYSRVIFTSDDYTQVRLTINRFRGTEYIHLRKYYLDFDETWKPTKDGLAMPLEINNSKELFAGLIEILSMAECKEVILEHFQELLRDIY